MKKGWVVSAFVLFSLVAGSPALAADTNSQRDAGERIYGEELMTTEERQEYRRQLWSLRTDAERDHFRDRQRREMRKRALDSGAPLPLESHEIQERSGETEELQKMWPEDGLRRWPEKRGQAEKVLRRWPEEAPAGQAEPEAKAWTGLAREEAGGWRSPRLPIREEAVEGTDKKTSHRALACEPGRLPDDAKRPGAGAVGEEPLPEPQASQVKIQRIRRPADPETR